MKNKILVFLMLFFVACASPSKISQSKKVKLSEHISISLSQFRDILPKNALIKQWINYSRGEKSEKAQIIIKNFEKLSVTILSPFGIELMSLDFSGDSITKVSGIPGIKVAFFERAMADMLIIYGDKNRTSTLIGAQGRLEEDVLRRRVFSGETEVIDISYTEKDPWKSDVIYQQLELGYKLSIKTVSIEHETIYK